MSKTFTRHPSQLRYKPALAPVQIYVSSQCLYAAEEITESLMLKRISSWTLRGAASSKSVLNNWKHRTIKFCSLTVFQTVHAIQSFNDFWILYWGKLFARGWNFFLPSLYRSRGCLTSWLTFPLCNKKVLKCHKGPLKYHILLRCYYKQVHILDSSLLQLSSSTFNSVKSIHMVLTILWKKLQVPLDYTPFLQPFNYFPRELSQ